MFSCDDVKHKEVLPADIFTVVCFYLTHFLLYFEQHNRMVHMDILQMLLLVCVCVCVCNAHNSSEDTYTEASLKYFTMGSLFQ
jgi:NADH:ubiquinone oxidoreductase subunit 2 (subunit N)